MKTLVTRKSSLSAQNDEVIYLSLLLCHVKERLTFLTPGFDCTPEQYRILMDEKITLTLSVTKAILKSRGCTFVEEIDTTYSCNNTVLKLGGIYRKRLRA